MAIIRKQDRAALRFDAKGTLEQDEWPARSAALRRVMAAAQAVGRIEIEGGVFPWAGTAFVVAPRLALTASYVGNAIATSSEVWLNFANNPADEPPQRIRVAAVEKVHPYWRFCYLRLAKDALAEPLALASLDGQGELKGRKVAAIGYSSFDQRNEEDVQNRIFGKVFDVKRVSPGLVDGLEHDKPEAPLSLIHDASTLGGSGGAPLIDLATGNVLGIHYSGMYLTKNNAMCAWDARGDPQWEHLWTGQPTAEAPPPLSPAAPADTQIFDYAQIKAIKAWLAQARIDDDSSLKTLFMGLSPEFMGQVPAAELIIDRLELALDYLNDRRKVWGGYPPLYYVLTNARERRQFEPDALAEMDRYLAQLGTAP